MFHSLIHAFNLDVDAAHECNLKIFAAPATSCLVCVTDNLQPVPLPTCRFTLLIVQGRTSHMVRHSMQQLPACSRLQHWQNVDNPFSLLVMLSIAWLPLRAVHYVVA
jgi:hypothetical protein